MLTIKNFQAEVVLWNIQYMLGNDKCCDNSSEKRILQNDDDIHL